MSGIFAVIKLVRKFVNMLGGGDKLNSREHFRFLMSIELRKKIICFVYTLLRNWYEVSYFVDLVVWFTFILLNLTL